MRTRLALLLLLASAAGLAADAPTYSANIAPLLRKRCLGCHAASVQMGGLTLDSYASLMKGGNHGPVVVPGKSAESRLYLMTSAKIMPSMPMDGTHLDAADIDSIKAWIDAGALAPSAPEAAAPAPAASLPHIQPTAPVKPEILDLAWSPNGSVIALAGYREVRLVDASSQATLATLTGPADAVRAVAFSRDGKLLAAAGGLPARKGEVLIYDVASRKLLQTISGHADCIYGLAFSPDGKILATSSYDKLIKLWNVSTGAEIRTLKDHIDAVYSLAFTPDGKRLVSGSADRSVKVWDPATGQRLYTLSEPQDGINTVVLDPTGQRVAAGGLDKTIRVWKLGDKSAELENSLMAHEDSILRLAWSPDGKTLVSSSADGTIKILNAADLSELSSLPRQPDWVDGLQFSPDGRRFAAGRFDGSLTFYDSAATLHRASR